MNKIINKLPKIGLKGNAAMGLILMTLIGYIVSDNVDTAKAIVLGVLALAVLAVIGIAQISNPDGTDAKAAWRE